MEIRNDFLTNLGKYAKGAPPAPFPTWAAFTEAVRGIPADLLVTTLEQVEDTFVVNAGNTDYESWPERKRLLFNHAAVRALLAVTPAGATTEQIAAIGSYTGLGGFTDIFTLPPYYPKTLVEAFREQFEGGGTTLPSPESAAVLERVRDQYFTPLDVCAAMHAIASRTNPAAQDYLETSAGIGRMLRTGPAGKSWTTVELDPLLSRMVSAQFPTAQVYNEPFEQFQVRARREQRAYDIVIGNPPYGKLANVSVYNGDAESFFTGAGISLLRPGGTLVYLVRANVLSTGNRTQFRETAARFAVFRGAALLPSKTFPNVMTTTFAVLVFTRRAAPIAVADFSERERAFRDGNYLETEEAIAAVCGGQWKDGPRGRYLDGTPDLNKVRNVWLAAGPPEVDIAEVRPPAPPPPTTTALVPVQPETQITQEVVDAATVGAEQRFVDEVTDWIRLINKNPVAAEAARESIRNVVVEYVGTFGNPHPNGPAALRAVTTRDGGLDAVLTSPVTIGVAGDEPPADASLADRVDFYAQSRGYATIEDLGVSVETAAADPEIFIDLRADGVLLYPQWAYFSGSPAGILANIDRSLTNPVLSPTVRAKLDAQKAAVLAAWSAPRTISEIGVTPRSPFVPLEVLQDWVNNMKVDPNANRPEDREVLVYPKRLQEEYGPLQLVRDNDYLSVVNNEALAALLRINDRPTSIYWLIGYCNRESLVDALGAGDSGSVTVRVYNIPKDADPNRVILDTDAKYVSQFRDWVSDSPWVAQIEAEYNTRFAPRMISKIPSGPVNITGQSPSVVLHPHQNQIVRRCTMGGKAQPFLWAADVGAGKTFAGSATLLRWRQIGAARRPIAIVPTSVLEKWYADGKRAFPNARIGVIGIEPFSAGGELSSKAREAMAEIEGAKALLAQYEAADTPEKYGNLHRAIAKRAAWTEHRDQQIQKLAARIEDATARMQATRLDSPDTRLEKWLRFAAGGYDYLICGMDAFFRDVEPSEAEVGEVLLGLAWASRESAKEANNIRRKLERIRRSKKLLAQYQAATTFKLYRELHAQAKVDTWADDRASKMADLQTSIEKAEQEVRVEIAEAGGLGTQSEMVKVQQIIRQLVASRKYRPNAGGDEDTEKADEDKEIQDNEERQNEDGESFKEEDAAPVEEEGKKKSAAFTPLPGLVMWSDLGIDALVVDEAHRFKNLWYPTQKIEYAGKGQDGIFVGTRRSWDMLIKTRLIHRNAGGTGGVLFLTATPMVNSPLELYTLTDMVNPNVWQDSGIYHKESFIERYWELDTKSVLLSSGSYKEKLILKGFQNGDEMMGVISTIFQRLSTAELVAQGWIRNLPDAAPYRLDFARDGAQVAVVRTLAAIYAGWNPLAKANEATQMSPCRLASKVPLVLSVVDPETGEPVYTKTSTAWESLESNFPTAYSVLGSKETKFVASGILALIWQTIATKAAMSPLLILDYAESSADRIKDTTQRGLLWQDYERAHARWVAGGKRGNAPDVPRNAKGKRIPEPKPSEYIRDAILTDLLPALGLNEIKAYYDKNPVIPKIRKLAQIVSTNVDRAVFEVPGFTSTEALPEVQAAIANAIAQARQEYAVFVQMREEPDSRSYTVVVSGPKAQVHIAQNVLVAGGVATAPVRDQGRCGHVVFCDFKALHPQIRDAIVAASGGAIPAERIVFLPKDKAKRLLVSREFNGTPDTPPKYDVVIGSSALMSEGVDLQRRSCAVHHLDLPWEPATLHQRNGRAVRQGNTMSLVDVIYYLTERSYDAVRFDKIANKGAWWDLVFSGQRSTSNPAADKENELANVDEIILSMVIEDPVILEFCLKEMRAIAEKKRRAEMVAVADQEWIAINGLFSRARSNPDEARRNAALAAGHRRIAEFRARFSDLGLDSLESAMNLVPQVVVPIWWDSSEEARHKAFPIGAAFSAEGRGTALVVLDATARAGFTVTIRKMGSSGKETRVLASLAKECGPDREMWTYAEERPALIKKLGRAGSQSLLRDLAELPLDLAPHATDLWAACVEQTAEQARAYGRIPPLHQPMLRLTASSFVTRFPIIALEDGRVVYPMFAGAVPPLGDEGFYRALGLFQAIQMLNPTVYPLESSDGRAVWIDALKNDKIAAPENPSAEYEYRALSVFQTPSTIKLVPARAPRVWWEAVTRRYVGGLYDISENALAEILRQRASLTEERVGERFWSSRK